MVQSEEIMFGKVENIVGKGENAGSDNVSKVSSVKDWSIGIGFVEF